MLSAFIFEVMYNKEFSQKGRESVLYFSLSRFLTNLRLIYAHKCWALFLLQSFKLLPARKAMNAVLYLDLAPFSMRGQLDSL